MFRKQKQWKLTSLVACGLSLQDEPHGVGAGSGTAATAA